ncbi:MAG: Gfo/Idh/MocA family oxidoreductase [Clostridia bacterium]|nr:Gfo/Idh/MocA family oxidoreductase [Clostridia bacterium]
MLNVVQIGSVGHYAYALTTMRKYKLSFVGVCYPHEADNRVRAERNFARFGFEPPVYDDWREMLETLKPDIAIVNTVMAYNCEIARTALSMGISVFCEKPLATTLSELATLEETYAISQARIPEGGRRPVLCAMFGIDYLPHFETAYRYVKSGALGDIRLANAQKSYRMGNREAFYSDRAEYGGTIPWVAIHAIEWVIRIGGLRPVSVSACASTACNAGNGTMEASTLCLFACEGGRMASVSADVMRPATAPTHDDDRLRLVGSRGILEVRGGRVYVIDGGGEHELTLAETETELFEEMVMEMLGRGTCRVSAEDAFLATRAALTARDAADGGAPLVIV